MEQEKKHLFFFRERKFLQIKEKESNWVFKQVADGIIAAEGVSFYQLVSTQTLPRKKEKK